MKTIHSNSQFRVYINCPGEIFVEHVDTKCTLRISDGRSMTITDHNDCFELTSFNGLGGFYLRPRSNRR